MDAVETNYRNKLKSEEFLKELIALCEKYGLAALPTYRGEVSCHDPMYIVPLDDFTIRYLKNHVYEFTEPA